MVDPSIVSRREVLIRVAPRPPDWRSPNPVLALKRTYWESNGQVTRRILID